MADDITIPASGTGTATPKVATDDVGGSHYQKVKLDLGADGASSPAVGTVPVSGTVNIDDSTPIDVNATVNVAEISGDVANGDVDAGNPVKIGGKVSGQPDFGSNPTAVGDRVDGSFSIWGEQLVTFAHDSGDGTFLEPATADGITAPLHVKLSASSASIGSLDSINNPVEVNDAGGSLTVDVGTALPAGTNNIGDVDVVTLPSIPAGANNIGDVDVLTVPAPLSTAGNGTAATAHRVTIASDSTGVVGLAAGTNAIGKLAANSGVDIGDVDVTSLPALPAGSNNIGDVDIASSVVLTTKQASATATLTNVNDTNVSTTLLASNSSRLGATLHNDSTAILYVKFGTTASTTSYTVKMVADAYYEVPYGYTGRIDGIWASDASGAARITEMT